MRKIIVTERQLQKIISEQRIYLTGVHPGLMTEVPKMEDSLRSALYSPAGIAVSVLANLHPYSALSVRLLFFMLLLFDISKWIQKGEPNWLYLICDLLCCALGGFSNAGIPKTVIIEGQKVTFKSFAEYTAWLQKTHPEFLTKTLVPFCKNIKPHIATVAGQTAEASKVISKYKAFSGLANALSKVSEYLTRLEITIAAWLKTFAGGSLTATAGSAAFTATSLTFGRYYLVQEFAEWTSKQKWAQDVIKLALPPVNALLGSDKLNPFIVDLITKDPKDINLNDYDLNDIFRKELQRLNENRDVLSEARGPMLVKILTNPKFMVNTILLIKWTELPITRMVEHGMEKIDRLEGLIRQGLANGKVPTNIEEIRFVNETTRQILDKAAKHFGKGSWKEYRAWVLQAINNKQTPRRF